MYELEFTGLEANHLVSSISVMMNNNADVVRFILQVDQQSVSLHGYNAYLKVESKSGAYFNKEKLIVIEDDGSLLLDWTITEDYTLYEHLNCQLQFQSDNSEEVVWQSKIFYLKLNRTLSVDGKIVLHYPTILSQLEAKVNNNVSYEEAITILKGE